MSRLGHLNPLCSRCGAPIDLNPGRHYQKASGWVIQRKAGGTNHIVHRELHQEYRCIVCVEHSMTLDQRSLF